MNFSTGPMMFVGAIPTTNLPLDPMIGFVILIGATLLCGLVVLIAGLAARPSKVVARRIEPRGRGGAGLRWGKTAGFLGGEA